jgi:hypothetical protein
MAEHARMLHGRCPGYLPAFFLPRATSYFYDSVDELIRDTEALAELATVDNYDVYLGTTTLASAPLRGRGGVDDVLAVPALYGDFDVATGVHGRRADGLPLPPTVEEARDLITAVGMEPS